MKFQRPTGTRDWIGGDLILRGRVEKVFLDAVRRHGFETVVVPTFEDAGLFRRSVGEGTDVVEKEMFEFGGFALRPEGTAGVARAFVENALWERGLPARLAFVGPMFRNETSQLGRFREFVQASAEVFGASSPGQDAEMIMIADGILRDLHVRHVVKINTVGAPEERRDFSRALVAHFEDAGLASLCPTCRRRIAGANPFRVLDCKTEGCGGTARTTVPPLGLFIGWRSMDRHAEVVKLLVAAGVPFVEDTTLVRGLDYYDGTVFEISAAGLGAQDAVAGGGRYDRLVESLGGPPTPAVGFAIGVDRAVLSLKSMGIEGVRPRPDVVVVPLCPEAAKVAVQAAEEIRARWGVAAIDWSGRRLKNAFAEIDRLGAPWAVIVGADEASREAVQFRSMSDKSQLEVPLMDLGDVWHTASRPFERDMTGNPFPVKK